MINISQQAPFVSFHRHMENFASIQGGLPQNQSVALTVLVPLRSFIMKTNKILLVAIYECMFFKDNYEP